MVEHFGHLTQRPSGISFFFDLELESFGFLTKVVVELAGGGVTAGSILSSPKDFFVNDAVAMGFRDLIVNVPENYFRTENTKRFANGYATTRFSTTIVSPSLLLKRSTSNSPNIDSARAVLHQYFSTRAGRRSSG